MAEEADNTYYAGEVPPGGQEGKQEELLDSRPLAHQAAHQPPVTQTAKYISKGVILSNR